MKFNDLSKYLVNSYWIREIIINFIKVQYRTFSLLTHCQVVAQILHYKNYIEYD
jgi:hypothetical protein